MILYKVRELVTKPARVMALRLREYRKILYQKNIVFRNISSYPRQQICCLLYGQFMDNIAAYDNLRLRNIRPRLIETANLDQFNFSGNRQILRKRGDFL